jgi:osmotically-inducible protein OsmY
MRILHSLAIVSSLLLAAGCESHRQYAYTSDGRVISTTRNPSDVALETDLRTQMDRYGDLASVAPNVQIYSQNGTVTLSGQVPSERDRQMIEVMVRNTAGVADVNDQLQVAYPPTGRVYTTPPPAPVVTAPGVPEVNSFRVQPSTSADEPVARRIVERLRQDSIPPEWLRDVTINVTGAVANLQGVVDSAEQRQVIVAAVDRTHGVHAVYDQLRVR